jgi:hypothetical protein
MTVSTVILNCVTHTIDILGDGLLGDANLKIKNPSGVYIPYTVLLNTTYVVRLLNSNPPAPNGEYQIEYAGRVLFTSVLICPVPDLSGIYFIDPTRRRNSDVYNNQSKKIPDPTIRTALIGT